MSLVAVVVVVVYMCVGVVYEPALNSSFTFIKKNFFFFFGVISSNYATLHDMKGMSGWVIRREGLERKQCFS